MSLSEIVYLVFLVFVIFSIVWFIFPFMIKMPRIGKANRWLIVLIALVGVVSLSQLGLALETPEDTAIRLKDRLAKESAQKESENSSAKTSQTERLSEYRWRRIQSSLMILKSSLKDPESLIVESLYEAVDASIVCINYRAKNSFGGFSREFAAINEDGDLSKQAGKCASKKIEFIDYTGKAKYAM